MSTKEDSELQPAAHKPTFYFTAHTLLPKHHEDSEHRTENTKVLINLLSKPALIFQHWIENTPILWRKIPEGFCRILCSSVLHCWIPGTHAGLSFVPLLLSAFLNVCTVLKLTNSKQCGNVVRTKGTGHNNITNLMIQQIRELPTEKT